MSQFQTMIEPFAKSLIRLGEELLGYCIGTQSGILKSQQVIVVVTPERLVIQGINRDLEPQGEPMSIAPDDIAKASLGASGGTWPFLSNVILDASTINLRLRTTSDDRFNLMLLPGGGNGPFAALGGSDIQSQGVLALAEWLGDHVEVDHG